MTILSRPFLLVTVLSSLLFVVALLIPSAQASRENALVRRLPKNETPPPKGKGGGKSGGKGGGGGSNPDLSGYDDVVMVLTLPKTFYNSPATGSKNPSLQFLIETTKVSMTLIYIPDKTLWFSSKWEFLDSGNYTDKQPGASEFANSYFDAYSKDFQRLNAPPYEAHKGLTIVYHRVLAGLPEYPLEKTGILAVGAGKRVIPTGCVQFNCKLKENIDLTGRTLSIMSNYLPYEPVTNPATPLKSYKDALDQIKAFKPSDNPPSGGGGGGGQSNYGFDNTVGRICNPNQMYFIRPDYHKSYLELEVNDWERDWFVMFQVKDPKLRKRQEWETPGWEPGSITELGLKVFAEGCRKVSQSTMQMYRKDDPSHKGKQLIWDMMTYGLVGFEVEKTGLVAATCNVRTIEACPDADYHCKNIDVHDFTKEALDYMNGAGVPITIVPESQSSLSITSFKAAQAAARAFLGGGGGGGRSGDPTKITKKSTSTPRKGTKDGNALAKSKEKIPPGGMTGDGM